MSSDKFSLSTLTDASVSARTSTPLSSGSVEGEVANVLSSSAAVDGPFAAPLLGGGVAIISASVSIIKPGPKESKHITT